MLAHQVLHVALHHAPRFLELRRQLGDVDLELFNVCADAIVNSTLKHLSWLELPPRAVMLEDLLSKALGIQQDAQSALLEWDLESLYRAIDDRRLFWKPAIDSGAGAGEAPAAIAQLWKLSAEQTGLHDCG